MHFLLAFLVVGNGTLPTKIVLSSPMFSARSRLGRVHAEDAIFSVTRFLSAPFRDREECFLFNLDLAADTKQFNEKHHQTMLTKPLAYNSN